MEKKPSPSSRSLADLLRGGTPEANDEAPSADNGWETTKSTTPCAIDRLDRTLDPSDPVAPAPTAPRREDEDEKAHATQLAGIAAVEARARATLTEVQDEVDERIRQVRQKSEAQRATARPQAVSQADAATAHERASIVQHQDDELSLARLEVRRIETKLREAETDHLAQLETAEARAEERLALASAKRDLARALYSAELRHIAEIRHIMAEAERTLTNRLVPTRRESKRDTAAAVPARTEPKAQERPEAETEQVRAEVKGTLAEALESAQARAAERLSRVFPST